MTEKQTLRRALIKKRREYAALPSTAQENDAIKAYFLQFFTDYCSETAADAPLVFCYVGVGWEVPTREIIESLLSDGVRVCVPRCLENGIMDAVEIASFDDLHRGMYDLWEPDAFVSAIAPADIDIALVPATAFDRHGNRLGRGGGYYDRFLARLRDDCITVGLAYDAFLLDTVPTEEYDLAVMHILTENGVLPV